MATWRRRDLERRSSARNRRFARLLRVELVVPLAALVFAAIALWQALAAQSRADLLAHDLSIATAKLRSAQDFTPSPDSGPATPGPGLSPDGR